MQTLETEINQVQTQNQTFQVSSNEDLVKINTVLRGVKMLQKKVCDELDPEISKAHKTHKGLTELKKKYLKPLEEVEAKITNAIKAWTLKQEEEARLLQERINKDLAEKAEALRQEKLKEAEGADEFTRELVKEQAEEIKNDTVSLEACKEATVVKQDGQYKRSCWKARIINQEIVPKAYWIINEELLDKIAKHSKGQEQIPGVEFWDDFTIVTKI